MVGNISNNPNTINPNLNTDTTTRVHKHGHHHHKHINTQDNNNTQKPDAISSATKNNGGDHYFETRA